MLSKLNHAIEKQNEHELEKCLIELFNQTEVIDVSLYPTIAKVMVMTWHNLHEDIVNMIYLKDLKDNLFVKPIMQIAQNKDVYMQFDDELESTLRKCVHALKTIGTNESNQALEILKSMNNNNVNFALEIYN